MTTWSPDSENAQRDLILSRLFRVAGYGLLIFILFEVVNSFIPLNFGNPLWESGLVIGLTRGVPIAILGLVMVFYGELKPLREQESFWLNPIAWALILVSFLYVLLIPLGLSATVRINVFNNVRLGQQTQAKLTQLQKERSALEKVSAKQAELIFAKGRSQGHFKDSRTPQELRKKVAAELDDRERTLTKNSQKIRQNARWRLVLDASVWILNTLIAGVVFFSIWRTLSRDLDVNTVWVE